MDSIDVEDKIKKIWRAGFWTGALVASLIIGTATGIAWWLS
jgi:hypothetical protein